MALVLSYLFLIDPSFCASLVGGVAVLRDCGMIVGIFTYINCFCCPAHQSLSEKGSTLNKKAYLPLGLDYFPIE